MNKKTVFFCSLLFFSSSLFAGGVRFQEKLADDVIALKDYVCRGDGKIYLVEDLVRIYKEFIERNHLVNKHMPHNAVSYYMSEKAECVRKALLFAKHMSTYSSKMLGPKYSDSGLIGQDIFSIPWYFGRGNIAMFPVSDIDEELLRNDHFLCQVIHNLVKPENRWSKKNKQQKWVPGRYSTLYWLADFGEKLASSDHQQMLLEEGSEVKAQPSDHVCDSSFCNDLLITKMLKEQAPWYEIQEVKVEDCKRIIALIVAGHMTEDEKEVALLLLAYCVHGNKPWEGNSELLTGQYFSEAVEMVLCENGLMSDFEEVYKKYDNELAYGLYWFSQRFRSRLRLLFEAETLADTPLTPEHNACLEFLIDIRRSCHNYHNSVLLSRHFLFPLVRQAALSGTKKDAEYVKCALKTLTGKEKEINDCWYNDFKHELLGYTCEDSKPLTHNQTQLLIVYFHVISIYNFRRSEDAIYNKEDRRRNELLQSLRDLIKRDGELEALRASFPEFAQYLQLEVSTHSHSTQL